MNGLGLVAGFVAVGFMGLGLYYLLVVTEGVYLGRRVVVWLYDLTAHRYDGIKEYEPEFEDYFLVRPLLAQLKSIPTPLILDVATGTGRVPYFLMAHPTFHGRVIGLDASQKMLWQAVAKCRPYYHRTTFVQQAADRLPFPANTFDAVTCLEALEFFPSDGRALREMARVLKPGGVLLVTRRKGKWGKLYFGHYRNVADFEAHVQACGLEKVYTIPWQAEYDQVYGRKPNATSSTA